MLVADLEREHAALGAQWRHLRPLLAGIAAGVRANLSPKEVAGVRAAYAAHIAREEGELIPLAARTFDAAALAAHRQRDGRAPRRRSGGAHAPRRLR